MDEAREEREELAALDRAEVDDAREHEAAHDYWTQEASLLPEAWSM